VCDYCGCRSEPEIAALSADHEHMLSLTARLRRAHAAGEPLSELAGGLADLLGPHARREEVGVFAALLEEGIDSTYVERFEQEHENLEALTTRDISPGQALQLVELLEGHIFREETDLFPAAHQLLGSDAWTMIAASHDDRDVTAGDAHHHDHDHDGPADDTVPRVGPAAG